MKAGEGYLDACLINPAQCATHAYLPNERDSSSIRASMITCLESGWCRVQSHRKNFMGGWKVGVES